MLEQLGGSPQDEDQTVTPKGSPDPALLITATMGRFDDHPRIPGADGTPETRDTLLPPAGQPDRDAAA